MTRPTGTQSREKRVGEDDCPPPHDLLDLAEARGDEARLSTLRGHLLRCSACQEAVGDLLGSEGFASEATVFARGQEVGRYIVLDPVGAGAMGVVYEAYDPKLERKVALKLVRMVEGAGQRETLRARLAREAQAMAKLAHPNVVAVHDVGEVGDRVFIAMELVTGGTLGAWLQREKRTDAQTIAMFSDAGRGLAAAHAAGLVHRDFKPENVLVGADGRARVTDFGLARMEDTGTATLDGGSPVGRATLTRAGAAMGTPAYMAPEQLRGEVPDARADVYAFSVALYEALTGERPFAATTVDELRRAIERGALKRPRRALPARLGAALKRGLAANRDERFASMDDLLAALRPSPRRRLWIGAGAGAALIAGGVAAWVARGPSASAAPTCEGGPDAFGDVWGGSAQARVRAAFERTGVAYAAATFEGVSRALAARREAWIGMYGDACAATKLRGTQSQALLERRTFCLEQRRRETASLVDVLATADEALVERAGAAVEALTSLEDCANPRALGEAAPVNGPLADQALAGIATARAERAAGHYQKALDDAEGAARDARSLGDPSTLAAALVTKGFAQEELMRYADAASTYHEAVTVSLGAGGAADAADAWMHLAGISSYRWHRTEEGYQWLAYAEAMIDRLGDDKERKAKLYERRSLIEWSLDAKLDEANRDYAHFLAFQAGLPVDAYEQFLDRHGPVAFDEGRFDVALRVFEDEIAKLERDKGKDHPEMLEAAENKAEILALLGRPEEAIPIYRDLLQRFPERAAGYTNHRFAEAYRKAGDAKAALEQDRIALAAMAEEPEDSADLRQPLTGLGLDLWMLGRPEEAIAPLEQALKIARTMKLATARADTAWALARALWDAGTDRPRAVELAVDARDVYRAHAARYGSTWLASWADEIDRWAGPRRP